MRNQERISLLEAIVAVLDCYPNWRLGQLVANIAGWADVDVWDVEDEQLLAAATAHLQHIASCEKLATAQQGAAADQGHPDSA